MYRWCQMTRRSEALGMFKGTAVSLEPATVVSCRLIHDAGVVVIHV